MAYARWEDPEAGKYRLLSARPDGTDEDVLHIGPFTNMLAYVAWSPDGKSIACTFVRPDNALGEIDMFDLASREMTVFRKYTDKSSFEIVWTPDGRGLLTIYQQGFRARQTQIGFVSYPGGIFRTITNDTNNYLGITLSADGKTLATAHTQTSSEVDIITGVGRESPASTPGISKRAIINDVAWASDGELLVVLSDRIVRMGTDGTRQVTILSDPASYISSASVCNNAPFLILSWYVPRGGSGRNIWRVQTDASDPQKLTQDKDDVSPRCSSEGKWVYFVDAGDFRLMRVPSDGGRAEPVPGSTLPNAIFQSLALARDGETIAFLAYIDDPNTRTVLQKLALIKLASNPEMSPKLSEADQRASGVIEFTPDGKAVAFVIEEQGVSNIWVQPLDGSKGRQITNFTSASIGRNSWSPNGKSLVLSRLERISDAILIRDQNYTR
jgi:eukaryotic-like serine/threonine-protein kinase